MKKKNSTKFSRDDLMKKGPLATARDLRNKILELPELTKMMNSIERFEKKSQKKAKQQQKEFEKQIKNLKKQPKKWKKDFYENEWTIKVQAEIERQNQKMYDRWDESLEQIGLMRVARHEAMFRALKKRQKTSRRNAVNRALRKAGVVSSS